MERAACRGMAPTTADEPDPWFPERGEDHTPGKMVCFSCPVRSECSDYQQRTGSEHGMWAGEIVKRKKKAE